MLVAAAAVGSLVNVGSALAAEARANGACSSSCKFAGHDFFFLIWEICLVLKHVVTSNVVTT